MSAIFGKDSDRAQAAELRRLLIRLQNGDGEDRPLGADIVTMVGAPAEIGDPTGCLDCALYLAEFLKFERLEAIAWATNRLKDRVRGGWKAAGEITNEDAARAVTCVVLKGQIARLERAPI